MSLPVEQELQQEANNRLEKSAKDPGFVRLGAGRIDIDQIAEFMGKPKPWGTHSVPSFLAPFLVLNNVTQTAASRFREKEAKPEIWDNNARVLDSWLSVLCLYMFQDKLGVSVKYTHSNLYVNEPFGATQFQPTAEQGNAQVSRKADATQDMIRAFKTAGRPAFDPQGGNPPFWFLTELQAQFGGNAYTFAILDDELMLCPTILSLDAMRAFKRYVPWYKTGENKIRDHLIEAGFGVGEKRLTPRGQMLYNTLKTIEAALNAPAPGMGNIQLLIRYLELAGNAVKSEGVPFPAKVEESIYKFMGDGKDDPFYREQQMHVSPSLGVIAGMFLDRAVRSKAPGIDNTWTEEAVLVPLTDDQYKAFEANFRTAPLLIPNLLPVNGTRLYLLPPVHNEIYEYLHSIHGDRSPDMVRGPEVTVRSEAANALFKVEVTMSFLDNEREVITRIREYVISLTPEIKNTLWLMDSLPYLSLWPDVDLPEDKWGLYLLAQSGETLDGDEKLLQLLRSLVTDAQWRQKLGFEIGKLDEGGRRIKAKDLRLRVDQVEPARRVSRVPGVPHWTVHQCGTRPKNIKLLAPDSEHVISSLNLKPIPENDPLRKPGTSTEKYQVALDFGTSSTLMWIAPMRANGSSGTQRSIISGADYITDLFEQTNQERREDFHRYCWIRESGESMDGKNLLGKVNSIAIVYGATGEPVMLNRTKDIIPFVNGSILRRDVKVSEDVSHTYKPLTDFGVFAGLKFFDVEDDKSGNGENRYWDDALCLFFAHLLTLAALDARMSGVTNGNLRLVAAGPDRGVFERMNTTLFQTLDLMNAHQFKNVYENEPVKVYAEANAVHAYMEEMRPESSCFVPVKGGVIVDIGGGTTDIYIAHGNPKTAKPVCASFHLAGDRLIRRAIVFASAKYPLGGSTQTPRQPGLQELSMLLAEAKNTKESNDLRQRFLGSYEKSMRSNAPNPRNENEKWLVFPSSIEAVRNMYPSLAELVDVLMSEFPPRYELVTTATNLQSGSVGGSTPAVSMVAVSEVLKLHYLLLFCLIAELLKNNTKQLDINNWKEIDIFLSGYGARGLGFCCGMSLDMVDGVCANSLFFTEVLSSVIKKVAGLPGETKIRFVMPFEQEKLEVVRGLFCSSKLLEPAFNDTENPLEQPKKKGAASKRTPLEALTTELVSEKAADLERLYRDAIESIPSNTMTRWFRERYKSLLKECEGFAETGYQNETSFESIRQKVINYAVESRLLDVFDTQGLGVWYWLKVIEMAIRRWGELPKDWKKRQEKKSVQPTTDEKPEK